MSISLPIAFVAGVISFFAPCVVPLLPAYIAYVTGVSLKDLKENGYKKYRKTIIRSSFAYVIGFSLLFTLLGTTAGGVGIFFRRNLREIQILGGLLMIIFGLDFSGIIPMKFLAKQRAFVLPSSFESNGAIRAFVLGIIFAITWSPCVGPILGSIYALAVSSGSAGFGAALLFVYSLGISIPFLVLSLSLVQAPKYLKLITKYIQKISFGAGIILILLGLLLVTGYYAEFNAFLLDIGYRLGYKVI